MSNFWFINNSYLRKVSDVQENEEKKENFLGWRRALSDGGTKYHSNKMTKNLKEKMEKCILCTIAINI